MSPAGPAVSQVGKQPYQCGNPQEIGQLIEARGNVGALSLECVPDLIRIGWRYTHSSIGRQGYKISRQTDHCIADSTHSRPFVKSTKIHGLLLDNCSYLKLVVEIGKCDVSPRLTKGGSPVKIAL